VLTMVRGQVGDNGIANSIDDRLLRSRPAANFTGTVHHICHVRHMIQHVDSACFDPGYETSWGQEGDLPFDESRTSGPPRLFANLMMRHDMGRLRGLSGTARYALCTLFGDSCRYP